MSANHTSRENTRRLTLAGVLSALVITALFLESVTPTGRLGFYVLAAFFLSVILLECGAGFAWAGYAATSVAGFLIVPEKLNVIPYIAFFGLYTLVKYHIERIHKRWLEIALKLLAFNLFLWPAWSIFGKLFLPDRFLTGWWVVLAGIAFQIMFIAYDILFTAWIRFYFNKIAYRMRKT